MGDSVIRKIRHFFYCLVWEGKDALTRNFIDSPKVMSLEDTYKKILNDRVSVSRFGDGEFKWMARLPQDSFQDSSELMRQRLIQICKSDNPDHIVCLSDTFGDLKKYNNYAREFWGCFMGMYRKQWVSFLKKDKIYYNTNMTRPYMDYVDKSLCKARFDALKMIWEGRNICIIEGEKSRLGVGNDLFAGAVSIKRILAPATNAFARYDEILDTACIFDKNTLILIALGPTATILAYDLSYRGHQAIDIGHVDVEYEWFLMGAESKVPIKNKYVNESLEGRNIGDISDSEYNSQIVRKII